MVNELRGDECLLLPPLGWNADLLSRQERKQMRVESTTQSPRLLRDRSREFQSCIFGGIRSHMREVCDLYEPESF